MDWTPFIPYFKVLFAGLLGGIIGLEREHVGKSAGTRTYSLVAIGAALFTVMSEIIASGGGSQSVDPTRMAGQIVVGIGFLGAGVIMHQGYKVRGLTTAAALWVVAAIGVAVGAGFYQIAAFTAFLVFSILAILGRLIRAE